MIPLGFTSRKFYVSSFKLQGASYKSQAVPEPCPASTKLVKMSLLKGPRRIEVR
jgi:hypothetical protein